MKNKLLKENNIRKSKEKYKLYEIKGITLISLVITIIILIILAGITINLAFGKNGILRFAKEAKEEYKNSELIEIKYLEQYKNEIDKNSNLDVPDDFSPIEGEGDGTGTKMTIIAKTTGKYNIKEYKYYLNSEYVSSTTEEKFLFDNLTPLTEYSTYVVAIDDKGNEKKSDEITFCTGQYLFKEGNEYTDITGGWKGIYWADNLLSPGEQYYGIGFFNKDNNKLNFGNNSDNHGDAGFQTNNSINLQNYKKLIIKGVYSTSYYKLDGYPQAHSGFTIKLGENDKITTNDQSSKTNAILNYEYIFNEKTLGKEIEKIYIFSSTGWQPKYKWYASISEIFMLK